jgi:hypothetical protein
LVEEKKGESDRSRPSGKKWWEKKDRNKSKETCLKKARKIRRYNETDVHKKHFHNNANEHETRKSEDTNEEDDIECIFCQETLNFANGESWFVVCRVRNGQVCCILHCNY